MLLIILFSLPTLAFCQSSKSLEISYLGHGAIRPGIEIGFDIPLKNWIQHSSDTTTYEFSVRPQMGYYGRRNFYSTTMANVEVGLLRSTTSSPNAWGLNLGFGYLQRFEVIDFTVNLAGEIVERNREVRGYYYPNLAARWERILSAKFSLITQLDYGIQLSSTREKAGNFFLEFGLKIKLPGKSNVAP